MQEKINKPSRHEVFSRAATEAIFILDNEKIIDCNHTATELFMMDYDQLINKLIFDIVAPESRENLTRNIFSRIKGPYEITALKGDHNKFFAEIDFKEFALESKTYKIASIRDITDRINAEDNLQFYQDRFEISDLAQKGLHIGYWDYTPLNNNYIFSKSWCDLLGYDYFEIDNTFDFYKTLIHSEDLPFYLKALNYYINSKTPVFDIEYRILSKDNTYRWVLDKGKISERDKLGKPSKISGFYLDITEKKISEQNLKKKNNDFNNLLMGILGNVSLILFDIDKSHPQYKKLKEIEQYTKQGSNLTDKLIHSAKDALKYSPNNLNTVLTDILIIFKETKPDTKVLTHLSDGEVISYIDKESVENLFLKILNTISNHYQPENIIIETSALSLDNDFTMPYGLEKGQYVKISFNFLNINTTKEPKYSEPGCIFNEELFPYAFNIAREQSGIFERPEMSDNNIPVNIYLPLYASEKKTKREIVSQIIKGRETILLIDDEDIIIKIGKLMTEKLGYKVITANSGMKALQIYKTQYKEIDLIILDIVMPDMDGIKVADQISMINDKQKILFSSGYSRKDKIMDKISKPNYGFIAKPFNIQELSRKLREILDT